MPRWNAIRWAREIPTLLHNGRTDKTSHHVLLVMATYARNTDGRNVFVGLETLARESRETQKDTQKALERLQNADLIRPEHASNGIPGWALSVEKQFSGDPVVEDRKARKRASDAERQRRRRERQKSEGHAEVDRDVTPDSTVTDEGVTDNSTVSHAQVGRDTADVTHNSTVSHAQDTVTPAGQEGYNSIGNSIKKELHGELHTAADADASGNENTNDDNLIPFPGSTSSSEAASTRSEYTQDFEQFWAAYERRGSKKLAATEWRKALTRADRETIMRAVAAYVAATPELRYRKHAERWLRDDCWDSAVPDLPKAAGGHQPWQNPSDNSVYDEEF